MVALVYGSTGYTGSLIARMAEDYGIRPVLAGRNEAAVSSQARQLSLEHRSFSLDKPALTGVSVVLHCAGPFFRTSEPMATACLRNGVHYIDITGEIEVFEQMHKRDAEARVAGVMLLPGAGFDVVPTDCLASHLAKRLPGATRLMLGIAGTGHLSHGTATTMVEHADGGGMIRRHGQLTRVPAAWRSRDIDFGHGLRNAVTIPWGDVATAYYSTGIPDIEVYSALPAALRTALKTSRYLGWLLKQRFVKDWQLKRIKARPAGPSEAELKNGKSFTWGRVEDDDGNFFEARCEGPNGYLLTAHTALMAAKRVLGGDAPPGFQTPSLAYGADFVLGVPNFSRADVDYVPAYHS